LARLTASWGVKKDSTLDAAFVARVPMPSSCARRGRRVVSGPFSLQRALLAAAGPPVARRFHANDFVTDLAAAIPPPLTLSHESHSADPAAAPQACVSQRCQQQSIRRYCDTRRGGSAAEELNLPRKETGDSATHPTWPTRLDGRFSADIASTKTDQASTHRRPTGGKHIALH